MSRLERSATITARPKRVWEILANYWVVDGNLVTGQNQNAAPMVARLMLEQLR